MAFDKEISTTSSPVFLYIKDQFPGLSDSGNPAFTGYAKHMPRGEAGVDSPLHPGEHLLVDRAVTHRLSWSMGAEETDTEAFPAPWRRGNEAIALHQQRHQYATLENMEDRLNHTYRVGQSIVHLADRQASEMELTNPRRSFLRGPETESQLARTAIGKNLLEKAYFATSHSLGPRYPFGKRFPEGVYKNDPSIYAKVMLQSIPDYLVDDVRLQVTLVEATQPGEEKCSGMHLIKRGREGGAVYAPHFPTGWLLGGVFGDLLVDNCLVAVNNADTSTQLRRHQLRELIACTLLDTNDQLGIESVGVYKSRRGYFYEYALDDLASMLGARAGWPQLREQFYDLLLAQPPQIRNGSRMSMESAKEAQKIRQLST